MGGWLLCEKSGFGRLPLLPLWLLLEESFKGSSSIFHTGRVLSGTTGQVELREETDILRGMMSAESVFLCLIS
jgi:hypothetical protein